MKKSITAALSMLALLLTCLSFTSCSSKKKFTHTSFEYFDTVTVITGYAHSKEEFDNICSRIDGSLENYHRLFDIYNEYDGINNLASLNSLTDGEHPPLTVDKNIIDLLSYGKKLYAETDGKLNIAMGSVLSIWHEYREAGTEIPPDNMLNEAAKHVDIDSVVINEAESTVHITDAKVTLDVGAVAKGYAAEMIADMLSADGITGYLINLGGNVRAVGRRGDGEHWSAGIENPDGKADKPYFTTLELDGLSLVTSGSYQRYYTVDGVSYHHIIDPDTQKPAEGYLSVSVITEDSTLADALSTALFCMSVEDGMTLISQYDGVDAMWVENDGNIIRSSGFEKYEIK